MIFDSKELRPGEKLGRYQLLLPIARGGMGQVWAARRVGSRGTEGLVAIKTLLPTHEDSEQLQGMLRSEARLASQIRHPNVAETLELGEQNGTFYLVMEWVEGEPLEQVLRAARSLGGIPIPIAVNIIVQGLRGLHAAHDAHDDKGQKLGLVHRDISPQNLLVTYQGKVKLVDFGVAKATHRMSQPTAMGEVKGKFAYMAPEQVQGERLDARADVFAMGIVLYRITTGKHPFKSDNPAATIRNILSDGTVLPSQVMPGYPPALEKVVLKALVRDRQDRFASAREMMEALEAAIPAEELAKAERETEPLLRRLFESRIAERAMAMHAAIRHADGDLAALELTDPRYPMSHPSMRAVALRTSEGMLLPSEGSLRIEAAARPGEPLMHASPSQPPSPERTRAAVKSFHPPKPKRQGWPALIAVAAGLLLPLAFQTIHRQRAAAVEPVVTATPLHSTPIPPPASVAPPPPQVAAEAVPAPLVPAAGRDAGAAEKAVTVRPATRLRAAPKKPALVDKTLSVDKSAIEKWGPAEKPAPVEKPVEKPALDEQH
ncbi:MAG: protein kinase [Polyangiaceae bacterium]